MLKLKLKATDRDAKKILAAGGLNLEQGAGSSGQEAGIKLQKTLKLASKRGKKE